MEQGFDLQVLLGQMASGVPLWAIALGIVKHWMNQRKEHDKEIKEQFVSINEKLNRIEVKLASSGIDDLKSNIESLKESRTKTDMKVEALFRHVDMPKRSSDG